ncbi:putative cytochrome P450 [Dioscorea sansibarensis]
MIMAMAVVVIVLGLGLGCWLLCSDLLRLKGLPPGTMGWPFFGETSEFLRDGPIFMKNQKARYGSLFKTHILGCPTVVSMDAELNRLLMNEGKGLVSGYPQSMLNILGKYNISAVHGSLHKTMRTAFLGLIRPSMIRDQLLLKIDESMRPLLSNWNDKVIDIQEKTKELWLISILKLIAPSETDSVYEKLYFEIDKLVEGTLSLAINFPGTNYRRGLQARKEIVSMLTKIINERRTSQVFRNDMLDSMLNNEGDTKPKLTDEQIIDLLITLIYSGFETVTTTSMMAVKLLSNHPKALEELKNEHLEIR